MLKGYSGYIKYSVLSKLRLKSTVVLSDVSGSNRTGIGYYRQSYPFELKNSICACVYWDTM